MRRSPNWIGQGSAKAPVPVQVRSGAPKFQKSFKKTRGEAVHTLYRYDIMVKLNVRFGRILLAF